MKVRYIEMSGFRGFKNKVRLEIGSGFTVITGRNGVGKSTVCDAIEFAITGGIGKYPIDKSAKETLNDYLWWRGEGAPAEHYVSVAFGTENGTPFIVTRTREADCSHSPEEIEEALCCGPNPDQALQQLARTSIIRDEWIAALSLDLTDTERFDLVRSALGPVEGTGLGAKAKSVLAAAEANYAQHEAAYDLARNRLSELLTQQAELQTELSRLGDVDSALRVIEAALTENSGEILERLTSARTALSLRRSQFSQKMQALFDLREIRTRRQNFENPELNKIRIHNVEKLRGAETEKRETEALLAAAEARMAQEEKVNEIGSSLLSLVEHGQRLGLHEHHCPLCAAPRTSNEFESGLTVARARVMALSSGLADARKAYQDARNASDLARNLWLESLSEVKDSEAELSRIEELEQTLQNLFSSLNLETQFLQNPDELDRALSLERNQLIELELALLTVESSQTISKLANFDERIAGLRKEIEKASDLMNRSQSAIGKAKNIERVVKRLSAEIIDERLAQISPLLTELYQRLRPHADWRTIDYNVRGDVRRFLSLKVGGNLNPQFVFSSGQRRAAGLAFLLSVHLSRAWTRWHTLVLDDPVQHIDDFRALHLTEVLAALRLDGQQIICAVEDAALADLLCRRLNGRKDQVGWRYELDLGSQGSVCVASSKPIPPLSSSVLPPASGARVYT